MLQFTQEISKDEKIHQCADFSILEHLTSEEALAALKLAREGCGDICQHGGQCRNGECVCRDGWEGQFCEDEEESISAELIWFFIITVILVAAFLLFYFRSKMRLSVSVKAGYDQTA